MKLDLNHRKKAEWDKSREKISGQIDNQSLGPKSFWPHPNVCLKTIFGHSTVRRSRHFPTAQVISGRRVGLHLRRCTHFYFTANYCVSMSGEWVQLFWFISAQQNANLPRNKFRSDSKVNQKWRDLNGPKTDDTVWH